MSLRAKVPLVMEWLDALQFLVLIAGGVLLLVAGWRRDDLLGRFFVVVGGAIAVAGFAAQFLGWSP